MNKKKQLINIMFALLNKYPIEKITVEMIIDQCELSSRTSFYRYFQDKYQLMAMCYVNYLEKIKKEFIMEPIAYIEKVLQFMLENRKAFENMFKSEGQDAFVKFLYADSLKELKEIYMKSKGVTSLTVSETYIMELYISGLANCLEHWVQKGMDLSPRELADVIVQSVPCIIKNVIEVK